MSEAKKELVILENEPKRKMSQLKNDSQFLYNLFMREFEARKVTFSEVKEKIIAENDTVIAATKGFKERHHGEMGWGYSKDVNHFKFKYSNKIKPILERLSPDNVTESISQVEKLLDNVFKEHSNAMEGAAPLVRGTLNMLEHLLRF